ncbi:MAG: hypothetical protein OXH13_06350 [Chloroflexi bacterium]|nr:hypothetical protein [Chloroflexota bacterium]MCY3696433.1 hypothetical protein [Chloroflexota bacterium]
MELIDSFLLLCLTQLGVDHTIGVAWRPWFRIRIRSEDIHYRLRYALGYLNGFFGDAFNKLPGVPQSIVHLLRVLLPTLLSDLINS